MSFSAVGAIIAAFKCLRAVSPLPLTTRTPPAIHPNGLPPNRDRCNVFWRDVSNLLKQEAAFQATVPGRDQEAVGGAARCLDSQGRREGTHRTTRRSRPQMFDPSLGCLARGRSRGCCEGEHTDISTAQTQLATPDLSDGLGVVRMALASGVAAGAVGAVCSRLACVSWRPRPTCQSAPR